jgi:predicted enzyme related to lactoylglutathione lyase
MNRRNILRTGLAAISAPGAALLSLGCAPVQAEEPAAAKGSPDAGIADKGDAMRIQYLEVVTKDVDAVSQLCSQMLGVTLSEAREDLGGARTATLADGGLLGVRAPLNPGERAVVRPYMLVDDIKAAFAAAVESGAEVAMEPTEIEGLCQFAILFHGGIEFGLWQA